MPAASHITKPGQLDEPLITLSRAVEQSPVSIIITDPNGNIQYVNPKFEQLTGYTSAEAIGQNPRILSSGKKPAEDYREMWAAISSGKTWRGITGYSASEAVGRTPKLLSSGRHDAAFYAAMWDSLRQSGSWQGEIWNRRKNGEVYPEWLTITVVKAEDGGISHYVSTLTDITLRKEHEYHSTPSIGVTLFRSPHKTVDELLKRAALEADLRLAIREQQFVLYYQAQMIGLGSLTGAEALVRWRHPRRDLVSPLEFIPLAEETGLILPLGQWVLETACDLKRLPLDQLKIDQSFVRDVLSDPNDAAIAQTIVALAQSLGLGVIAEGVETETQRDFLASHGCHDYQGYLFSRPLPIEAFEQFLLKSAPPL